MHVSAAAVEPERHLAAGLDDRRHHATRRVREELLAPIRARRGVALLPVEALAAQPVAHALAVGTAGLHVHDPLAHLQSRLALPQRDAERQLPCELPPARGADPDGPRARAGQAPAAALEGLERGRWLPEREAESPRPAVRGHGREGPRSGVADDWFPQ